MPSTPARPVLIALVSLVLVALVVGLVNARRAQPAPIVIQGSVGAMDTDMAAAASAPKAPVPAAASSAPATVPRPAPQASALIYVHVAGAVKHPSLYQLVPGSRVWHAIKAAGGPTGNADEDAVNLAAKLADGEKIVVPTKAAVVRAQPAPAEAAAVPAPAVTHAAHAPASAKSKGGAGAAGKPTKLVSAAQGQVNINTAGAEQLQELPGIGPAMAARIVGYRQQAGSFQKAEDLMNVGGIGPKKFARIAPLVKLH